jgi:nicotinamidase/pyrazinamidase
MTKRIQLLIIDPQNDFCDLPADWCPVDPVSQLAKSPALPVAGAHADMLRLAQLVSSCAAGISAITLTLDSHHRFDIAHPMFWQTGSGEPVSPFTPITAAHVRKGEWVPKDKSMLARALAYLDELERRGRYALMVWPVHCEIGTWGHNLHPAIQAACSQWEDLHLAIAQKISKGSNPWTEHYSALRAEVPDPSDPATALNMPLIAALDEADLIVIAGEAGSHCVRATTEHLVENLPSKRPDKLVLLTDCMSPVAGFGAHHQAFLDDMARRGLGMASSQAMRPLLAGNA